MDAKMKNRNLVLKALSGLMGRKVKYKELPHRAKFCMCAREVLVICCEPAPSAAGEAV